MLFFMNTDSNHVSVNFFKIPLNSSIALDFTSSKLRSFIKDITFHFAAQIYSWYCPLLMSRNFLPSETGMTAKNTIFINRGLWSAHVLINISATVNFLLTALLCVLFLRFQPRLNQEHCEKIPFWPHTLMLLQVITCSLNNMHEFKTYMAGLVCLTSACLHFSTSDLLDGFGWKLVWMLCHSNLP